jgi:hypothetical protein
MYSYTLTHIQGLDDHLAADWVVLGPIDPKHNLQGGLVHADPNSDAVKAWTESLAKVSERPDDYQLDDQMRALLVSGEDLDADRVLAAAVQVRHTHTPMHALTYTLTHTNTL